MDDANQKERLEQELRFLKESFEAEVISKEEFEKGRDRVERKLRELEAKAQQDSEIKAQEQTDYSQSEPVQEKIEQIVPIEEKSEEKIKLNVIQDETETNEYFEPVQLKIEPEKKKESRFFRYSVVFLVLILVVFFSYYLFGNKNKSMDDKKQVHFAAACSTDLDCRQDGKEGACSNPGAKDAACEFNQIKKENLIILNDKTDCFNCGTERVEGILENWFGPLSVKEVDYNSSEGKELADKFGADLLPLYILDESISAKPSFEKFKQALYMKDSNYVLSDDASGSSFYAKRENIPELLDVFLNSGDSASIKAEKNLQEFLNAFKDIKFESHTANDSLTKELNIKSFPTFLVNNRIKFSGVSSAEAIKENFCKLNKMSACEKNLSKSLV